MSFICGGHISACDMTSVYIHGMQRNKSSLFPCYHVSSRILSWVNFIVSFQVLQELDLSQWTPAYFDLAPRIQKCVRTIFSQRMGVTSSSLSFIIINCNPSDDISNCEASLKYLAWVLVSCSEILTKITLKWFEESNQN